MCRSAIKEQSSSMRAQSKHEVNNWLLLPRASKTQKRDEISVEQPTQCAIKHSLWFLPIHIDRDWLYTLGTEKQISDTAYCLEGGKEEKGYIFTMLSLWRNMHNSCVTAGARFRPTGLNLHQTGQNYWRQSPTPTAHHESHQGGAPMGHSSLVLFSLT